MSRVIASFTFNYEIECSGIEASDLSYKLRSRLEQAARGEIDNLKDSEPYIKRVGGGLSSSMVEDVSSFADEAFSPFVFSSNEALYAGMTQSFATLMRQWNRETRFQVDRPEFQSAKMLFEDNGIGGKCMPKISSKFTRKTVSQASYEMDYAARRAITDAFVKHVVLSLEGAYEDGVEPSNMEEKYEEDNLF
jgi:hypothetical protein